MPFYEYECQACKFYTEVMQKISDAPLTKCPSCGKRRLKKLVSAPVFRLKGGGWYETDFKSDKEEKRNLVGADKDEAKAEGKPEPKDDKTGAKDVKAAAEPKAPDSKAPDTRTAETKSAGAGRGPARRVRRKTARRSRR